MTARGRCTALFPGAFQPPHEAHLAAALHLAGRDDVDQLVVIITNRCRGIPGTHRSLDAAVSQRIWQIYLAGVTKARIEIAPHTAVAHALSYIERAQPGERLLFCVGEQDLAGGDPRFETIAERGKAREIRCEVVAAPTAAIAVRATALREALARGEEGREDFVAGLPASLDSARRAQVWQICVDGLRDVADIVTEKLAALATAAGAGAMRDIRCLDRDTIDPAFVLTTEDGQRYFARYAGDAIESAEPVAGLQRKPRRRLKVERRALERLVGMSPLPAHFPACCHFDRKQGLLLLEASLPDGRTLPDYIRGGLPSADAAGRAARFLARGHRHPQAPFRDDAADDIAHWRQRLAAATGSVETRIAQAQALAACSELAAAEGFFHFNIAAAVRIEGERVAIVDFEHCGNFGDPALDLGTLLGACLAADGDGEGLRAAISALDAYRSTSPDASPELQSRALAFAGMHLLREGRSARSGLCATALLEAGLAVAPDAAQALQQCFAAR